MSIKPGKRIWVPCEVKPGPFSNERLVRVRTSRDQWVGFVGVDVLKDPVPSGSTFVQVMVLSVKKDQVTVRLPGYSVDSSRTKTLSEDDLKGMSLAPVPA